MTFTLTKPARPALVFSAVALAAALAGCAAPGAMPTGPAPATDAGTSQGTRAPLITVPPTSIGNWIDLGEFNAPWLAGDSPVPVTGPNAPTRVAGWRREDGRWLAIVLVQTAPANGPQCPLANNQEVVAGGDDGHCLRMRRNADYDGWMARQNSVLHQWLAARGWSALPRSWSWMKRSAIGSICASCAIASPKDSCSCCVLQPGTRWSYSVGLDLLGRVIEVASGQAFEAFLQTRLFDPLGMTSTTYPDDDLMPEGALHGYMLDAGEYTDISTHSEGEGRDRRLIISQKSS